MNKQRNRIVRLKQTSVEHVFEKETLLLKQLQSGQLDQCLMLWQTDTPTLVLPASSKWPDTDELRSKLVNNGWKVISRRTGGAPVPQTKGVINLSHMYIWPKETPYSIPVAYENLCQVLCGFFASYGLSTQVHATPYSYCDGDYNININQQKIVGTAQRVLLKSGGEKVVLAQACILINDDLHELVKPVNTCYALSGNEERVKAKVHTCLFDHIDEKPSIDNLFQGITQAFIDSELYK